MGLLDFIIIMFIFIIGSIGIKNGFFKQTVLTVGTVLVIVLAYVTKDFLANWFSYNLPFFNFFGPIEGLTSINIIMYQMLAFLIMCIIFGIVLAVLVKITKVFEKILNFTIILGIPSKILGFIVGAIEGYILAFVILFFICQPAFNFSFVKYSKFAPVILNSSPGLSSLVYKTVDTIDEMYNLVDDYNNHKDANRFNKDSIDLMLKNEVITKEYVNNLIDKGKISIIGIDEVLNKY